MGNFVIQKSQIQMDKWASQEKMWATFIFYK